MPSAVLLALKKLLGLPTTDNPATPQDSAMGAPQYPDPAGLQLRGASQAPSGGTPQMDASNPESAQLATPDVTKPRNAPAVGGNTPPSATSGKLYLFPDGKTRTVSPNMEKEAIKDGVREAK